ncbi:hypothetical protein PAAG_08485 [Paracoccidioides lutzii Pb01]|uniref:Uncharacterized protein n=1 Tax=Paracoccidioides lutzii (strain ATCC MYA-826 / Pb01) TaxID=502779 RepID=C1HCJ4_PARBA|nr:hypothetical protein PAAG_08485 [Paracoccidioides lutzii Pb01]EEH38758.2 hypothetical protein PAAG_08485 [Paracoccidioides lutzii Pb01]
MALCSLDHRQTSSKRSCHVHRNPWEQSTTEEMQNAERTIFEPNTEKHCSKHLQIALGNCEASISKHLLVLKLSIRGDQEFRPDSYLNGATWDQLQRRHP